MKHFTISRSFIALILLLSVVWSCKTETTPTPTPTPTPVAKSSAKAITKFSFAALSPAVEATIDATAKTISATVPAGTDATKLIPTITVSDKATISPATGVAQDFSKGVSYTVTAEDASSQNFTVTVTNEYPTNGLLAYYPFNGNAKDKSGNGIDGIVNGATLTTDRKGSNSAYLFDGKSNITFSGVPPTGVIDWTISFWVKFSSLNQLGTIVSLGFDDGKTGDGVSFGMGQSANMAAAGNYFNLTYNGIASWGLANDVNTLNEWKFYTFTKSGDITTIYINGSKYYQDKLTNKQGNFVPLTKIPSNFTIGSGTTGGPFPRFFKGAIDDVRIYKRVLTSDEIKLLTNE